MIYVIGLLTVLLGVSIYVNFNLYYKVFKLEKEVVNTEIHTKKVMESALRLVFTAKTEMDKIDFRGAFANDDETGFTFKALHSVVDTLAEELQKK